MKDSRISFRIDDETKTLYQNAAAASGKTLSQWIHQELDLASAKLDELVDVRVSISKCFIDMLAQQRPTTNPPTLLKEALTRSLDEEILCPEFAGSGFAGRPLLADHPIDDLTPHDLNDLVVMHLQLTRKQKRAMDRVSAHYGVSMSVLADKAFENIMRRMRFNKRRARSSLKNAGPPHLVAD